MRNRMKVPGTTRSLQFGMLFASLVSPLPVERKRIRLLLSAANEESELSDWYDRVVHGIRVPQQTRRAYPP